MADESSEQRLTEIFERCTGEFLTSLGVKSERVNPEPRAQEDRGAIAAFSGFGNDDVRGSYALVGPTDLFSRLHPLPPTVTTRDLADWACEAVNQVVGRFRNRLAAYGIAITISVPQGAVAKQLRVSSSLHANRKPVAFMVDGMLLEGWIELDIKPGFKLPSGPSEQKEPVLDEGAMVIF